jgi:hypothetical protein
MIWLWTATWSSTSSPKFQCEGGECVFDFNSFGPLGHTPNR